MLALGRAHDFVRPNAEQAPNTEQAPPRARPASLKGMLDSLLRPYANSRQSNVAITGPDIRIDDRSATPLALFFHELATNSAKYGALSTENGRVDIAISETPPARDGDSQAGGGTAGGGTAGDGTAGDGNERWITLSWQEHGGPPVAAPRNTGFGYRLIDMSISRQLGGSLTYAWNADGLGVTACIPRPMLTREGEYRIHGDGDGT